MQYPCFSSTASNLGTNSLIAFRNGFKSVAIILCIDFNTVFIHKKRFRGAVPRDCSGNHNFS